MALLDLLILAINTGQMALFLGLLGVGSLKVSAEWLCFKPHGPFLTAAGAACSHSVEQGAGMGVPRVEYWDPVYSTAMTPVMRQGQ